MTFIGQNTQKKPLRNQPYIQVLALILFFFCGLFGEKILTHGIVVNNAFVYFTPGDNCTQHIVDVIDSTQKEIYIQAYGFTSKSIAQAVDRAIDRNVIVRILLDKSNIKALSTPVTSQEKVTHTLLLPLKNRAEVLIDYLPGIAHNKVIIADEVVITGSFNFTYSAQKNNAENIIILHNRAIANLYRQNWYKRHASAKKRLTSYKQTENEDEITINANDDNYISLLYRQINKSLV